MYQESVALVKLHIAGFIDITCTDDESGCVMAGSNSKWICLILCMVLSWVLIENIDKISSVLCDFVPLV